MAYRKIVQTWLIAMAVVCLALLLDRNMLSNEADKLPLALRQVCPGWMAHDWYLAWPQSHQWLFQAIAGWPLRWFGFPLGSLLDRLLGYGIWSLGFSSLAWRLGLWPVSSALALAWFLPRQGLIAGEWVVGGAESKTWAYGLLMLAFALWSGGRWPRRAAFMAGLACSFHALVGLYGAAGLLLLERLRLCRRQQQRGHWLQLLALGVPFAGGAFALLRPLSQQVHWGQASPGAGGVGVPPVSWIYVYLRLPHHLVPSAWAGGEWWAALLPLLALLLALGLWRWLVARRSLWCAAAGLQVAVMTQLGAWTAWAVALFGIGLAVAPFDGQGRWLRFYPFRLADSLLPLLLALLLAALLQVLLVRVRLGRLLMALLAAALLLSGAPAIRSGSWFQPAQAFAPVARSEALYGAIRHLTAPEAVVLTPPEGFQDLPWRLQRSPVVQFKLFPSESDAIVQWYGRLAALAGEPPERTGRFGFAAAGALAKRYSRLSPVQLTYLAQRYRAAAVVTVADQQGPDGWQRVFQDRHWALWLAEAQRG
jgi:hypothetical protein